MKPKRKHSAILEDRLRRLPSDLPPTNFSVHPRDYETNQLWLKIDHANGCAAAAAAVKSWLPAPTRRCAGPPQHYPQLRHISAGPPRNPAPRPHNHFLRDSDSILEAALEKREASYWCLLERSYAKRKPEIQTPSDRNRIRRKMRVYGVGLCPNDPYSGLTVTYALLKDYNSDRGCQPPLWLIQEYTTIRYECAVSNPFDARRKPMEFADVIRCGGKYYAVSLQGAVVAMEVIDTRLRIAAVGLKKSEEIGSKKKNISFHFSQNSA